MLPLLAAVLISQSPSSSDEAALRKFIDTQLVSVTGGGAQPTFRRGERSFTLLDEAWSSAFVLVPEAHELALSARKASDFGMTMWRVGTAIELTGLVGAGALLVVTLAGVAVIPLATMVILALVCGGLGLAGAVVSLIGLPSLIRAQERATRPWPPTITG